MKKIIIFIVSVLIIASKCGECDDCGDNSVGVYEYSLINSLSTAMEIKFVNSNQSKSIIINSFDTTQTWEMILLPVSASDHLFTREGGFDFNVDEINVLQENNVLKVFYRDFLNYDMPQSSIFNWHDQFNPSYSRKLVSKVGNKYNYKIYYILDSTSLGLN